MSLIKVNNTCKFCAMFILLVSILAASSESHSQTINAPGYLEAEPEENQYIKVKWDDNSNNEAGFYIERSLTGDTTKAWETIGGVQQNIREFFDYWVTNQISYCYRVYAYRDSIRSEYSNISCTTAVINPSIPAAPSNLEIIEITKSAVTIQWQDNSDNELGFIIAKRKVDEVLFIYIDTVETDVITYQEVGLTPDRVYLYKVCSYNAFGVSDFTNTVSARTNNTLIQINSSLIPSGFFLKDNYPNPFNPETKIEFGIAERSFVELTICNSLGMEIDKLVNGNLPAGTYQVKWNAQRFSTGTYFYRIRTEYFSDVKKMILIK